MKTRSAPGRADKSHESGTVSGRQRPRNEKSGNERRKTPTRAGKLVEGAADDDDNSKGHLTYSDKSSYKLQSTFYVAKELAGEHGEESEASGKGEQSKSQLKAGRETEQRVVRADEKTSSMPKSPEFFETTEQNKAMLKRNIQSKSVLNLTLPHP